MRKGVLIQSDRGMPFSSGRDERGITGTFYSSISDICDGADKITAGTLKTINIDCDLNRIMNKTNAKK